MKTVAPFSLPLDVHPGPRSRGSLKSVLPALVPEMTRLPTTRRSTSSS